uniref:Allantoin racemase n=1 Tax=Candidatus Kentrum sp. LFY TaxID=2126342 RepID=A0A450UMH0_9GAMM|nr:MAG: allantoin racemase [Candidatus Kentron sp. LFY]
MRLLIVNGNSTQAVTQRVVDTARQAASAQTHIEGMTVRFGANLVRSRPEEVLAAHAVLDVLAEAQGSYDAAILAISLDSGLFAARQLFPVPILGMTEASFAVAGLISERFGLITLGSETTPLYRDLLRRYGAETRLAGWEVLELRGTDFLGSASSKDSKEAIIGKVRKLATETDSGVVVLCCAVHAGIASRIREQVPLPVIDGIAAAVMTAEMLARADLAPKYSIPLPGLEVMGVSSALQEVLHAQR